MHTHVCAHTYSDVSSRTCLGVGFSQEPRCHQKLALANDGASFAFQPVLQRTQCRGDAFISETFACSSMMGESLWLFLAHAPQSLEHPEGVWGQVDILQLHRQHPHYERQAVSYAGAFFWTNRPQTYCGYRFRLLDLRQAVAYAVQFFLFTRAR